MRVSAPVPVKSMCGGIVFLMVLRLSSVLVYLLSVGYVFALIKPLELCGGGRIAWLSGAKNILLSRSDSVRFPRYFTCLLFENSA